MGATGVDVAVGFEDGAAAARPAAGLRRIWWRARTCSPWRDVPQWYGSWETLYSAFRRWQLDGTWARFLKELQVKADTDGIIEWEVSVDSTVCRAHQHAAGARKKGLPIRAGRVRTARRQSRTTTVSGRSRGSLTTRIHLAVDASFNVLAMVITAGQRGDAPVFEQVIDRIRVPGRTAGTRAPGPPTRSAGILPYRAHGPAPHGSIRWGWTGTACPPASGGVSETSTSASPTPSPGH